MGSGFNDIDTIIRETLKKYESIVEYRSPFFERSAGGKLIWPFTRCYKRIQVLPPTKKLKLEEVVPYNAFKNTTRVHIEYFTPAEYTMWKLKNGKF